ncbi:sensor histidine kinase [Caenispirillum bisanense]|uniref:histidine kinase n=1 Tax=Caenispirillum bisanense TaxID=414052 RepID=A0A286G6A6_9PROT|nr:HAMP domain-containing sensor histidine kinase [Caenispirillum bisanense]SOD90736.1 PAS fold-containing protein [Caenispirillum bisanense]
MADALPNQLCVLDARGRVVFVNAAWRRFAEENLHCGGSFLGVDYVTLCEAAEGAEMEDARTVGRGLREVLAGRLDRFEHVYPCHAPACTRWFRVQATPFGSGLVVQHVPAADPAKAEDDLVHVLSHVAHELRTPLGAIVGYSDLLTHVRDTATPVQRDSFTAAIHRSSLYLSGVIEDMMELARSQRQRDMLTLNETVCDLEDLAADACAMVSALAADRALRLTLERHRRDDPVPMVLVDRRRLTQVLVNLLTNAIKFSPRSSAVVCRLVRARSGGWRTEIVDNGPGMSAEEIPLAFAPYGRTASARKSGATGLGLGLPLSKALVELHGGTLILDSSPGRGTTAVVDLPAWRTKAAAEAATAASGEATADRSTAAFTAAPAMAAAAYAAP